MEMKKVFVFLAALLFPWTAYSQGKERRLGAAI